MSNSKLNSSLFQMTPAIRVELLYKSRLSLGDEGQFTIEPSTGVIRVSTGMLDYDAGTRVFNMMVEAKNDDNLMVSRKICNCENCSLYWVSNEWICATTSLKFELFGLISLQIMLL